MTNLDKIIFFALLWFSFIWLAGTWHFPHVSTHATYNWPPAQFIYPVTKLPSWFALDPRRVTINPFPPYIL